MHHIVVVFESWSITYLLEAEASIASQDLEGDEREGGWRSRGLEAKPLVVGSVNRKKSFKFQFWIVVLPSGLAYFCALPIFSCSKSFNEPHIHHTELGVHTSRTVLSLLKKKGRKCN